MAEDKFCSFAFANRLVLYIELIHSSVYSVKEKVKEESCQEVNTYRVGLANSNSQ